MRASLEWLGQRRAAVRARLMRDGHLLIRGLPIATPGDFALARDVLIDQHAVYREKATPRSDYGGAVFSSTDLPAAQPIALHNENSYTTNFPGLLLFCCLEAPDEGGATTVADVREVLARLPLELIDRFRTKGWLLTRTYHEHVGLPWRTAFAADSREEVAVYCDTHLIACAWQDDGLLRTVQRRPAVIRHPATGEEVWFNHAAFWSRWSLEEEVREVLEMTYGEDGLPFHTAYGDGQELGPDDVAVINDAYAAATRREHWQPGDLLLVDNILSAHGRDSFRGNRQILVAMGQPVDLSACAPTVAPTAGATS